MEKMVKKSGQNAIEEHMNKFFTPWGFESLHSYTKNLIKEWHKRGEQDYPFTIGIIMGIPFFNSTTNDRKFNNKSELEGRIKGYMQLMCFKTIEVDLGNDAKLIFDLGD